MMKKTFYKHNPLMLAVITFMFLMFGAPNSNAAKGDFWLEVNGTSFHGESDYHDGWDRTYYPDYDWGKPLPVDNLLYTQKNGEYSFFTETEKRRKFNSANFGLGLKYGLAKYADAFVGFYDNSYDKTSFYGGVNIKRDFHPGGGKFRVAPGLKLGLVTGYAGTPDNDAAWGPGDTAPMAIPNIEVGYGSVYTNAGYIPAVGENSTWAVMVQGGIRIDFFK
jgi:hypothetical protein